MAPAREDLMFNNLIESSSHKNELKRRGSFVLYTVASYAIFFAIAGVASIYAYDAHLEEDQSTEISILTFAPPAAQEPVVPDRGRASNASRNSSSVATQPVRPVLYERADNPTNPPTNIGTTAQIIPPAPPGTRLGNFVADLPGSGSSNNSGSGSSERGTNLVTNLEPAPTPAPTPVPASKILKLSTLLNGKALDLPKPAYPPTARLMRLSGAVNVQVVIDESGKVVSARALEGPPILKQASERAAYQARFSPTILGGQPVKVSGVIVYNFVLQQ
jgi:TonB family protein